MIQSNLKKKLILILFFFLFRWFLKFGCINYKASYNDILTNERKLNYKHKPKISVIIPIYNGGKYLIYSLASVQRQKMKDIEIIIVDDNSSDNSIKIIRNFMKNDKRIKLITNKVNRKILFCKSIGTLNSKGKYIIELDQDDMFIRNDAFNIIYKQSEKSQIDILNFNTIYGHKLIRKLKKKIHSKKKGKDMMIKQPKIKFSIFKTIKFILWGSLIKADLYKKVIYNLWPIIINYKIIFQEDYIVMYFILLYSKRCKRIKDRFLYHYFNKKSASAGYEHNPEYLLSIIFAGNIYYDYDIDNNPSDLPIIMNYIKFLPIYFIISKNQFPSFFNYFFGKIITNPKLSLRDKNYLKRRFKIPENCGHYEHLNISQKLYIQKSLDHKAYDYKHVNQIVQISIVIIIQSNFSNISEIINLLNSQDFKFFEIIFVFDDIKNNNFSLLISNLLKYQNIKLINNEIKKGTMNSIIKGINISMGKYVIIFDEKCFFLDNNALYTIYNEIEKNELDILEFELYRMFENNYISLYKCKHFSSQFNFSKIKYNFKDYNIDINRELLTNKIIKTNFFRNCLKKYKLSEVNEIVDYYFNDIYTFILESNSPKYNHTSLVKVFKNDSDFYKFKFNHFISNNEPIIEETIFYINFIFENSKDTSEEKENVLDEFFKLLSIIYNKFTKTSESSIKLFHKFLTCDYISNFNKNLLQFYYKSLIN